MAKAFRPTVCYRVDYANQREESFPTYAEVKRRMKEFLEEADDDGVTVYRHRRGEWGEWFEVWGFNHKRKPVIVKQGWM
jgi:hypothetical protein